MQDWFRDDADRSFCAEFCTDADRFPTDNCRRCWISHEAVRIRDNWWRNIDSREWQHFAELLDDQMLYVIVNSARLEPGPCK